MAWWAARESNSVLEDYSGTRVDVSRNQSIQVDATNRERRPSTKFVRTQLLWFRSKNPLLHHLSLRPVVYVAGVEPAVCLL